MLSLPVAVAFLLSLGMCWVPEVSAVSEGGRSYSQAKEHIQMMRRQDGEPAGDPALIDPTQLHPGFDDRKPPPSALDQDFEQVRRIAAESQQQGSRPADTSAKLEQSFDDDNGRTPPGGSENDDLAQAAVIDDEKADGTQGYLDPTKVATGPDPNRAATNRAPGGTSMLGTSSSVSPIEDEHPDEHLDTHDDHEADPPDDDHAGRGTPDDDRPSDPSAARMSMLGKAVSDMSNLPDERDRPTNEAELNKWVTDEGKDMREQYDKEASRAEDEMRHWRHDADEERARIRDSPGELLGESLLEGESREMDGSHESVQDLFNAFHPNVKPLSTAQRKTDMGLETGHGPGTSPESSSKRHQALSRIGREVRKEMHKQVLAFKNDMSYALGKHPALGAGMVFPEIPGDGAESLLEEGSLSNTQRDDPAINMFDRVGDILDNKDLPAEASASVPGRESPAELAKDQADTQNSAMREADLAMKEMDDSSSNDFSKGVVNLTDLDDTEGLLVPKNGASIAASTADVAAPPTSVSQIAEDTAGKTLSADDILNGGHKADDTSKAKSGIITPDGELLLQAQQGSVSAMKKLALALKEKVQHPDADSLLDQNTTSTKKAEPAKADLFSDIMSDTGAADPLPVPKPTSLKDSDVLAESTDSKPKDLFATLGQTEAGVDMAPDERNLFADIDKESKDKPDQKGDDIFAALDKAPAVPKDGNDDSLFGDLGKPSTGTAALMQGAGTDSLIDSLSSKPFTPSEGVDSILDSLNKPSSQASGTGSEQDGQNLLDSLSKDDHSKTKDGDLSELLKELKA